MHQLTPSLAVALMPFGITVNCIDPGPNDTGYADERTRAAVVAANPGRRWSAPADTTRPVAWPVRDEAEWGHRAGDRLRRRLVGGVILGAPAGRRA
ncbi:hypothetical protein [Geodermatophilus sp. SYSU D00815]